MGCPGRTPREYSGFRKPFGLFQGSLCFPTLRSGTTLRFFKLPSRCVRLPASKPCFASRLLTRWTRTNAQRFEVCGLRARGLGNLVSGLIGGLPVTSVVVRSSANLNAGARTRMSAILHGVFLFLCVLAIPTLLNKIPLAALAAVLLQVGYKLAKVSIFKEAWASGKYQWWPFIATVVAVVFTDLLDRRGYRSLHQHFYSPFCKADYEKRLLLPRGRVPRRGHHPGETRPGGVVPEQGKYQNDPRPPAGKFGGDH